MPFNLKGEKTKMVDARCAFCGKLLCRVSRYLGTVEIKCPACHKIVTIETTDKSG